MLGLGTYNTFLLVCHCTQRSTTIGTRPILANCFTLTLRRKKLPPNYRLSVNCGMGHRCLRGLTMTVAVGKDDIVGASGGNDDNSDDGHCFSCVKLREIYDYLFMERN